MAYPRRDPNFGRIAEIVERGRKIIAASGGLGLGARLSVNGASPGYLADPQAYARPQLYEHFANDRTAALSRRDGRE